MLSIYERRWTPDQATLQVSTRPGYDQCCVLGKTLNTLIMRLFIKELTNRFRETVCETRKNAASLCYKKTSVQNHRSTNSLTHLRAASSSSWGLLVAPMTNILSLGSAMTWKKVKKTKKLRSFNILIRNSTLKPFRLIFGLLFALTVQNFISPLLVKRAHFNFSSLEYNYQDSRRVFQCPIEFVEFQGESIECRDECFELGSKSFDIQDHKSIILDEYLEFWQDS